MRVEDLDWEIHQYQPHAPIMLNSMPDVVTGSITVDHCLLFSMTIMTRRGGTHKARTIITEIADLTKDEWQ